MNSFAIIADLNNIQKQTKAMGKLNTSQMNVRSLSLSETGAMIYCSSIDISEFGNGNESTIPIMAQPTSPDSLVFNERLVCFPFFYRSKKHGISKVRLYIVIVLSCLLIDSLSSSTANRRAAQNN